MYTTNVGPGTHNCAWTDPTGGICSSDIWVTDAYGNMLNNPGSFSPGVNMGNIATISSCLSDTNCFKDAQVYNTSPTKSGSAWWKLNGTTVHTETLAPGASYTYRFQFDCRYNVSLTWGMDVSQVKVGNLADLESPWVVDTDNTTYDSGNGTVTNGAHDGLDGILGGGNIVLTNYNGSISTTNINQTGPLTGGGSGLALDSTLKGVGNLLFNQEDTHHADNLALGNRMLTALDGIGIGITNNLDVSFTNLVTFTNVFNPTNSFVLTNQGLTSNEWMTVTLTGSNRMYGAQQAASSAGTNAGNAVVDSYNDLMTPNRITDGTPSIPDPTEFNVDLSSASAPDFVIDSASLPGHSYFSFARTLIAWSIYLVMLIKLFALGEMWFDKVLGQRQMQGNTEEIAGFNASIVTASVYAGIVAAVLVSIPALLTIVVGSTFDNLSSTVSSFGSVSSSPAWAMATYIFPIGTLIASVITYYTYRYVIGFPLVLLLRMVIIFMLA